MASAFEVFLVTPEREVWSGQATILIARGSEGEIGIQNGHAPLLIHLGIGPLFIQPAEGERLAAAVDGGFLHVMTAQDETRVDILAEHAELDSEIDLDEARRQQAEAERRLQERDNGAALAMLAKAQMRISLRG